MVSPPSLSVGLAVIGALGVANLCARCIARRAGVPVVVALAELDAMNAARARRARPSLGPTDGRCLRCEGPRPVYRLC
jgi:hypothetical protein